MNLDYIANDTFAQVHNDHNKYIFIRGPVGSGKSSGCIWHLFLNAINQPPEADGVRRTKYAVIRASYPALKSTVIKSWKDWFKDLLKVTYDTPIRGEIRLAHPDGKTQIEMDLVFLALDREEDVNKLQSLELTGAHINEAAEIPRGIFQMLKSRIDRYPAKRIGGPLKPFILLDYNSVDTTHWLYNLAEETKPDKHSFYAQPPALLMVPTGMGTIKDSSKNCYKINPKADNLNHQEIIYRSQLINKKQDQGGVCLDAEGNWYQINKELVPEGKQVQVTVFHLGEDYYPDMVIGADPDWVNVFVLNNYGQVRTGRPVYREYNDAIHCAATDIKPIKGVPLIIGMDLGLTPAAAFCQLTPEGTLNIIDEIVTDDCSIQKFCEDFLWTKIRNEYSDLDFHLVIDPAAVNRSQNDAQAAWKIIKAAGLPFRTAKTNNPMERREAVVSFLRKVNGFQLSPKCSFLRKGFISEYKFEKVRSAQSEMFREKPEKNIFSHVHDGAQYGALEVVSGKIFKKSFKIKRNLYTTPPDTSGY